MCTQTAPDPELDIMLLLLLLKHKLGWLTPALLPVSVYTDYHTSE